MTSLTGAVHQNGQSDPILTLSQKVSNALSLGTVTAGDHTVPTISGAGAIIPPTGMNIDTVSGNVSITASNNAGRISGGGGAAHIVLNTDDTRTWTIDLPSGSDTVGLGGGSTTVDVGSPATISGGTGPAIVNGTGDLMFIGGDGPSTVLGGAGATTIFGGSGNLVATGGKYGDDRFIAGSGSETLIGGGADHGGTGNNTFEIVKGQSTDVTITDFGMGDKVEFDGYTSAEVAQAHLQATAGGTTITLADNTKITFIGMDVKTII